MKWAWLSNLVPGKKTLIACAINALLGGIPYTRALMAENPGLGMAVQSAIFALLRLNTDSPIFKPKPAQGP